METQYTRISMTPSGVPPVFYMSQYDVGRPIGFICDEDLSNYTVTLKATRTDGTPVLVGVTTSGNIGAFATTAAMTNKEDDYPAQIVISADGERIASIHIRMHVVKAAMDENSEAIEEDESLFQQYTETVQSLIAEIRTDVVDLQDVKVQRYDTVAQMKADTALKVEMYARTGGYYAVNDGGGALYRIREKVGADVDDGGSIIFLNNGTVAVNLLIKEKGYLDIRWFGAKADGVTDCSTVLQKCINISNDKYLMPIKIIGDFYVGQSIAITGSLCLEGIAPPARLLLTASNRPNTAYGYHSTLRFAAGITGFNITGIGSSATSGVRATELFIKNVEFIGTSTTKLFVLDAFGAPSRLSYIKNCHIHTFNTLLEAVLGDGPTHGTLISNFDISNNDIYSITTLLNVVGTSTGPTFSGLNIHDNTIEWCQDMIMHDIDGYCAIVNNLMEGWHGTIDITIGKGTLDFIGNGFEENTGKISIIGTNPMLSVCNIDKLFFSNSNPTDFTFELGLLTIKSLGCNTKNIKFVNNCTFGINAMQMLDTLPISCFGYNKQFIVPFMQKTVSSDVVAKQDQALEVVKDRVTIFASDNSDFTLSPGNGAWSTLMPITTDDLYVVALYYPSGNIGTLIQYAGYDNARTCGFDMELSYGAGYRFAVFKATKTESKGRIYVAKRSNQKCEVGAITFSHPSSSDELISSFLAVEDNNAGIIYQGDIT